MPRVKLNPRIKSSLSWEHRVRISKGMKRTWSKSNARHAIWKRKKSKRLIMSSGYIRIYRPTHHRAHFDGYVFEHILVAEKKYGCHLKRDESVHHLDGVRSNNDPKNIVIIKKSDHSRHHAIKSNLGKYGKLVRGERVGLAKLTRYDVKKIRKLASSNRFTYKQIADKFHVATSTINSIVNRYIWRWLK